MLKQRPNKVDLFCYSCTTCRVLSVLHNSSLSMAQHETSSHMPYWTTKRKEKHHRFKIWILYFLRRKYKMRHVRIPVVLPERVIKKEVKIVQNKIPNLFKEKKKIHSYRPEICFQMIIHCDIVICCYDCLRERKYE